MGIENTTTIQNEMPTQFGCLANTNWNYIYDIYLSGKNAEKLCLQH